MIVLAIMLARKEKGESHGGDSRDKEGQGQVNGTSHTQEKLPMRCTFSDSLDAHA